MAAPKRRSVAERNAAAIAQEVVPAPAPSPAPAELDEKPQTRDEDQAPAPQAAAPVERSAPRSTRKEGDRKVFGIYLTTGMYQEMKAAYLADWTNRRGDADTLNLWVEAALKVHAERTVEQRAERALQRVRGEGTSASRPFKIDPDAYAQVVRSIGHDETAGRWLSESAWSVEALAAAIDAATTANGGVLPEPPARLPNRLKRRA